MDPPERRCDASARHWVLDLDRLLLPDADDPFKNLFGLVYLLSHLMGCPDRDEGVLWNLHDRNAVAPETGYLGHSIALIESLYRDGGDLTRNLFAGRERRSHFIWGFSSHGLTWPREFCRWESSHRNRYRLLLVGVGTARNYSDFASELTRLVDIVRSQIWSTDLTDYGSLLDRVVLLEEAQELARGKAQKQPGDLWPFALSAHSA